MEALRAKVLATYFLQLMTGIYDNFETAVYKMGQVFAVTGRVLPVSLDNINLIAELEMEKLWLENQIYHARLEN